MLAAIIGISTAAPASEIVATIPPLAGMVRMLDPAADVTCLLTAGSDPHHFQLTPRQLERIASSTLLVHTSRDDGSWLNLNSEKAAIDLWPERDHAWLDPKTVIKALPRLAAALEKAVPEHRRSINENLKQALATAARIDRALATAVAAMTKRGVVMQHPSWRRVFEAYGVPVLEVLESERHGHELGPRHLEEALATLKQHGDALLVGDMQHSNRSLQWLAEHGGGSILYLDGLGRCGERWDELMQRNIERISGL